MTSQKNDALTPTPATDFDWVIDPKTGGVKIIGVRNKTATRIVVPEEIDGRPVIEFSFDDLTTFNDGYWGHSGYLLSLTLNSRCAFNGLYYSGNDLRVLTEIIVPANHPLYRSVDGVLFSADGKTLLVYPARKNDEKYVVPDGVERTCNLAFRKNRFLKSLTLPASWRGTSGDSDEGGLVGGPALTEFHVAPGNPEFYTRDTVLFYRPIEGNGKWEILYAYPPGKKERTYNIPDSVNRLACAAFNDCVHLRRISFPEHRITLCPAGCNPFSGCSWRLRYYGIYACSSVARIMSSSGGRLEADWNCDGAESFWALKKSRRIERVKTNRSQERVVWELDRDYNYVLRRFCDGKTTSFSVPERYKGRRVTRIGARAFANCAWLEEVTLPETTRSIEREAFVGCKSLRSITLSGKERLIGEFAFADCESLEEIVLPDSLRVIERGTFGDCKMLRSITLGSGTRKIDKLAFSGCEALRDVTLPDSASDEMLSVFQGKKLRLTPTASPHLRFVDGVVFSPDGKTLLSCPSDKSGEYVVPESVEVIENYAFSGCNLLTSVTFPTGLQTIGNEAFSGCGAELTLYAQAGAVAEEYARENGLRFEAVDAETGTSDADDGE